MTPVTMPQVEVEQHHTSLRVANLSAAVSGTDLDDWPDGLRTHRRSGWQHWYRSLDLRLTKRLARVDVITEVFNVFNTANFSDYQAIQSDLKYAEPVGEFPRRQGQIGIRYRF